MLVVVTLFLNSLQLLFYLDFILSEIICDCEQHVSFEVLICTFYQHLQ